MDLWGKGLFLYLSSQASTHDCSANPVPYAELQLEKSGRSGYIQEKDKEMRHKNIFFDEGSYTSVFMVWNWHPGFFPVDNVIVLCFTI